MEAITSNQIATTSNDAADTNVSTTAMSTQNSDTAQMPEVEVIGAPNSTIQEPANTENTMTSVADVHHPNNPDNSTGENGVDDSGTGFVNEGFVDTEDDVDGGKKNDDRGSIQSHGMDNENDDSLKNDGTQNVDVANNQTEV